MIYPAQPVGGEGDTAGGWPLWINGVNPMLMTALKIPSLRYGFGTEFFKNFVFNDSGVGLPQIRLRELSQATRAGGLDAERHRSEPRRVQGARRQAGAVARLVGSGVERDRDDEVLRAGAGARRRRRPTTRGCSCCRAWRTAPAAPVRIASTGMR